MLTFAWLLLKLLIINLFIASVLTILIIKLGYLPGVELKREPLINRITIATKKLWWSLRGRFEPVLAANGNAHLAISKDSVASADLSSLHVTIDGYISMPYREKEEKGECREKIQIYTNGGVQLISQKHCQPKIYARLLQYPINPMSRGTTYSNRGQNYMPEAA